MGGYILTYLFIRSVKECIYSTIIIIVCCTTIIMYVVCNSYCPCYTVYLLGTIFPYTVQQIPLLKISLKESKERANENSNGSLCVISAFVSNSTYSENLYVINVKNKTL